MVDPVVSDSLNNAALFWYSKAVLRRRVAVRMLALSVWPKRIQKHLRAFYAIESPHSRFVCVTEGSSLTPVYDPPAQLVRDVPRTVRPAHETFDSMHFLHFRPEPRPSFLLFFSEPFRYHA